MVSFVTRAGVVSLLVSVVFLGGCAAYDASSDYRLADDAADAFLEAVEKRDIALLLDDLSTDDKNAPDLMEGFDYACALMQSPASSVHAREKSEEKTHHHGISRLVYSTYDIEAGGQSYVLDIEFFPYDSIGRDKEGIYRVFLSSKSDYDEEVSQMARVRREALTKGESPPDWQYGATYERPGIYHPGWKEEDA